MIIFTSRELQRAWRQAASAFNMMDDKSKTNAHRLLLFYAVETGLKAVLLKRSSKIDSGDFEILFTNSQGKRRSGHDLNNLMDHLKVGAALKLSDNIALLPLKTLTPQTPRTASCSELNQVWRYGAEAQTPNDQLLEAQLIAIHKWICGELK
ncbi:MAG: hypothetical protein JSR71_11460 [Proteobacteria bacterium]|nr:hypothetical protein [Pseudomonadota bacterium]